MHCNVSLNICPQVTFFLYHKAVFTFMLLEISISFQFWLPGVSCIFVLSILPMYTYKSMTTMESIIL